ncbi:MAG: hypothetical protein CXX81_23610, partial [Methanobacteriota archaeon]
MLLGSFGHVIPSTDSDGGEGQSEGLDEPFDDLTLAQKQALGDSPVLTHVSGRNAEQTDDGMAWQWAVRAGGSKWEYGGGIYESGNDISLDSSGNSIIIGNFYESASFGGNGVSSVGEHD